MRLKKKLLVLAALLAATVLILTGCSELAEQVSSAKPTEFLELAEPAPEQAADRAPDRQYRGIEKWH